MHYYFSLSLIAQKRLIYFADGGEKPAEAEIVSSGVNDDRPNVAQLEKTIQEKKRSLDEKLATFGGNTQEVADELDRIWQQHVSYLNDAESQAESARRGHLQSTLTALDRLEQIVVEARQSFQQVRQGAIAHVDLGQSGGRVEAPAEATTSFPTSDPVPEPTSDPVPEPIPVPTPSDDASIPKIEPEAPSPDPLEVHQEDNGLEGNVAKEEEMTLEREERLHALPGLGGRPWRRQVVSVEHEEEPAPEESLELTADYQDVLSSLDAQELERMPVEQLIERMGKALKAIEQKMAALNVGDDVKAHFQQLIKSHQDRLIPMMSVTPGFSFDVHSGLSLRDPAKVKPVVLEVLSVIDSFNKELDVLGSSVPDLQKRIQAGEIFRVDVGRTGASGVGVADEVKAEQPPARPVVADNPVVQALQGGALGAIAAGEAVSEGKAPLVGDISGDKSGSVGVEKPDAVLPVAVPEAKAVYQPATPEERKAFLSDDGTIKLEDRGHEIRETVHSILSAKEEGGDLPEQVTVSYAERGKTRLEALARRKPQYQPLLDYVNSSDNRVVATKTGGDYVFDLPDGRKLHVPIWNGDKVVAGTEESGVAGEAGAVLEEASIAPVEEPTKSLANASPGPSTDIAEMRIDKSLFDELQGFKDRYYVSTHNRGTDFVFLDRRTGEELGVIPTDGLAKEDFEASLRSKMAEIQTVLDAKKPERLIEDQQTAMQQMIARILPKKFSTPNYPRDMMRALWNAGYRHSAEKPLELHIDAGASRLTVMLEGRIFSIKNQPDANRAFYDILKKIESVSRGSS